MGRGYDGWDSIHNAAERLRRRAGELSILYFGDFDPSGEEHGPFCSLRERLRFFRSCPEIEKSEPLTAGDIETYHLPPDFTKTTDSRRAAFVAKFGDVAVELDALPVAVLRERLERNVKDRLDLGALEAILQQDAKDRKRIAACLKRLARRKPSGP